MEFVLDVKINQLSSIRWSCKFPPVYSFFMARVPAGPDNAIIYFKLRKQIVKSIKINFTLRRLGISLSL